MRFMTLSCSPMMSSAFLSQSASSLMKNVVLPESPYGVCTTRSLSRSHTAYVAAAPKSNRAGSAYWAAMDDVLRHGSLPVPSHLRSATWREKRDFGHGLGYVYPHDYVDADVDQQYLPDVLVERRYYQPSDHGYERTIAERMANRRAARAEAADSGGPVPDESVRPKTDSMKVAGNVMARREEGKRNVAARQKREASTGD